MKILIVDDDQDTCGFMSDELEKAGYTVHRSYDGKSALDKIRNSRYDLILLDYKLPDMNGLQVLKKVRHIDSALMVIMMSGVGGEDVRSQAKALGVYDFIDKSYLKNIVELVKRALG
jgi:DNA-binding response OmpR family regulator